MGPVSGVLTAPKVNSNMRIFIWEESVYQARPGSARGNDKSLADLSQSGPLLTADATSTAARSHCGARLFIMSRNENISPSPFCFISRLYFT